MIEWGDGTSAIGTVTGTGGLLTVTGSHTYGTDSIDAAAGYKVKVTLYAAGSAVATASQNVVVTRPGLAEQVADVAVQADGTVADQTVATFEVPDSTDGAGEFQATIDWGDGSSSVGAVGGSNGVYQVVGGHTYAAAGNYSIQVEVGATLEQGCGGRWSQQARPSRAGRTR